MRYTQLSSLNRHIKDNHPILKQCAADTPDETDAFDDQSQEFIVPDRISPAASVAFINSQTEFVTQNYTESTMLLNTN